MNGLAHSSKQRLLNVGVSQSRALQSIVPYVVREEETKGSAPRRTFYYRCTGNPSIKARVLQNHQLLQRASKSRAVMVQRYSVVNTRHEMNASKPREGAPVSSSCVSHVRGVTSRTVAETSEIFTHRHRGALSRGTSNEGDLFVSVLPCAMVCWVQCVAVDHVFRKIIIANPGSAELEL